MYVCMYICICMYIIYIMHIYIHNTHIYIINIHIYKNKDSIRSKSISICNLVIYM